MSKIVSSRHALAYSVLIFSTLAITSLAIISIVRDPEEAKDIFNVVLPVFSSWVGTILAFYFGRENFESANEQVRELVGKLGPEERVKSSVKSIMRPLNQMTFIKLDENLTENDMRISQIREKFMGRVSRLPILGRKDQPKYMIHQSRIDQFLSSNGEEDITLQLFLEAMHSEGLNFGLNSGFVIVSENTEIAIAKQKMEAFPECQDIFVTEDGKSDAPLVGWISNIRLMKYIVDPPLSK
jgi:hypothetical protein